MIMLSLTAKVGIFCVRSYFLGWASQEFSPPFIFIELFRKHYLKEGEKGQRDSLSATLHSFHLGPNNK